MLNRNIDNEMKTDPISAVVGVTDKTPTIFNTKLAELIMFHFPFRCNITCNQPNSRPDTTSIWLNILSFLALATDLNSCHRSSVRLCKSISPFFQTHLTQIRLKQLLQHVVYGNQKEAEVIIKSNPYLLLLSGTVEDYSYGMVISNKRKNEGTAYQLALSAEDVGSFIGDVCMAEMIHSYLIKLPQGHSEIAKQTLKRFPPGWQNVEELRISSGLAIVQQVISILGTASPNECFMTLQIDQLIQNISSGLIADPQSTNNPNNLKKIIHAISQAISENDFEEAFNDLQYYLCHNNIVKELDFNNALLKSLYQFKNFLEPRGIAANGLQFNASLLAQVFDAYGEYYTSNGDQHSFKKRFFCQKIVGYIQRFLPANYAQAFAQGISQINEKHEPLNRSLKLSCSKKDIQYYPLDNNPFDQLGFDWCVPCNLATRCKYIHISTIFSQEYNLKLYITRKQSSFNRLYNSKESINERRLTRYYR